MSREALSLTWTDALRRARVKERLGSLATRTGLAPTVVASRALTLGLAAIEADLHRIFPDEPPAIVAPAPACDIPSDAPSRHAAQGADLQHPPAPSPPPIDGDEPSPSRPRLVPTAEAARALGYRDEAAFRQHGKRHPEILKLSKRRGRLRLWNLAELRSEYAKRGWQPKQR